MARGKGLRMTVIADFRVQVPCDDEAVLFLVKQKLREIIRAAGDIPVGPDDAPGRDILLDRVKAFFGAADVKTYVRERAEPIKKPVRRLTA
jgi:hypothetical protein